MRSARARTAPRTSSRAVAASGWRRDHERGWGSSPGARGGWTGGSSSSGSSRARSIARHHSSRWARAWREENSRRDSILRREEGRARAAATRAPCDRTFEGHRSSSRASSSRVVHSSRSTASDLGERTARPARGILRHGSVLAGRGGRVRSYSNSWAAQSALPAAASSSARAARSSMRSSTSRAAYTSQVSGRGRVDQSAAAWSLARRSPRVSSSTAASPTCRRPRRRAASSVSNRLRGASPRAARHGRSWSAACRIHSGPSSAPPSALSGPAPTGSTRKVPAPARRSCTR